MTIDTAYALLRVQFVESGFCSAGLSSVTVDTSVTRSVVWFISCDNMRIITPLHDRAHFVEGVGSALPD